MQYPNPCIVGMTGLEPATSRPPDACANQLRYIPKPCALKAFAFLATAKIVTICEITKLFREFLLLKPQSIYEYGLFHIVNLQHYNA